MVLLGPFSAQSLHWSILDFWYFASLNVDLLAKPPRVIITTQEDPKNMLAHAITTQQCTLLA